MDLVLYTRADCPLCDHMKEEIARAGPWTVREVDVDADPELVARYGMSVPVLEIDGRAAFKGRLEAGELRRKVERALRERDRRHA